MIYLLMPKKNVSFYINLGNVRSTDGKRGKCMYEKLSHSDCQNSRGLKRRNESEKRTVKSIKDITQYTSRMKEDLVSC